MAASAYAAVVSLTHVLGNVQQPSRHWLHFDRNQIETLRENVSFLLEFLEDYSATICSADNLDLARQIADVADEAEHVIDSQVVDQLSDQVQTSADKVEVGLPVPSLSEDMKRVINKIEAIREDLMMVKDRERAAKDPQPSPRVSSSPSNDNNTMVGFDEHLVRIMDQIKGDGMDLQLVSITGMGGIGKTTLAKNVFDNHCIVEHFDIRIWVTISQDYSGEKILLGLLQEIGVKYNQEDSESLPKLRQLLYESLFGKRYLIVMDDVWSTKVWDDLESFLPNNGNRSRIIVTTRLWDIVVSLGSQNPYWMDFLDDEKSWSLFCKKAFNHDVCPLPELAEVGKNIVKSCRGLPLAIVAIGGLLANSNMKLEYWEFVAKNVNSFANLEDDQHCLNILSLSYNHLPIYLKPCFLYLRVFREDEEIRVSHLIQSWAAQGFVKSKRGQTLEEVAHEYLKDLIDRNLILVHKPTRYSGRVKTCKIHDLLKDLCIREYEKEQVFHISRIQVAEVLDGYICFLCCHRNVSTRPNLHQVLVTSQPTLPANSLVCDVCNNIYSQSNRLRLVQAAVAYRPGYRIHVEFLQPTRLRSLHLNHSYDLLPTLLPFLWNLETIILEPLDDGIGIPPEIWDMPQLRHFKTRLDTLPDPTEHSGMLENLQTLSHISRFQCSEEILKRIPNLKKLAISYPKREDTWSIYLLRNLAHLHKLESLVFEWSDFNLKEIAFPHSLKKLCLDMCAIVWERMTIIGSLPNLEVLKLNRTYGGGVQVWIPVEGDFLKLKSLTITLSSLFKWDVEKEHFPKLEILVLRNMLWMEKIPPGIGEMGTLRSIHVEYCKESLLSSAKEMIEEQRSYGNEDLQLHVLRKHGKCYNLRALEEAAV